MPLISKKHGIQNIGQMELMEQQIRESKDNPGSVIKCGCGKKQPMRFMYRCYYCGVFFCFTCAADHFGQTRQEYYDQKSKEAL